MEKVEALKFSENSGLKFKPFLKYESIEYFTLAANLLIRLHLR